MSRSSELSSANAISNDGSHILSQDDDQNNKPNNKNQSDHENCQNGSVEMDEDSFERLSISDSIVSDAMTHDDVNQYPYDMHTYRQDPEDEQLSSRRAQVIRKILANFDLETVMEKYRGHSVMHSLSKKRQLLEDMMGDEPIPYSDRKWHEAIRQKVMEDLERQHEEKERRLAEAENQRILKLKLQGIIRDENDFKKSDKENKKSPTEQKFERMEVKKHQLYATNDIESQMQALRKDKKRTIREEKQEKESVEVNLTNEESPTDSPPASQINGISSDTPTYRSHLGRMKTDNAATVHPNFEKLYVEEDLDQLYKEAENLVQVSTKRGVKN